MTNYQVTTLTYSLRYSNFKVQSKMAARLTDGTCNIMSGMYGNGRNDDSHIDTPEKPAVDTRKLMSDHVLLKPILISKTLFEVFLVVKVKKETAATIIEMIIPLHRIDR